MKSIICSKPKEFLQTEAPEPRPGPEEALVRIRNIGICGTDLHAYQGQQPFFEYPRILGHELSAEVIDAGADPRLKKGDYVVINPYLKCGECIACRRGKDNCCQYMQVMGVHCDGGMRELITVPTENAIPAEGLELEQMATVECFAIGAHAVRRARLSNKDTVAVGGAGPIGIGVIQFAKITGARVIVVDLNDQRLRFCKEILGADATINATKCPIQDLQDLTGGDKPTTVFDVTGNKSSMEAAFEYCAPGGQLVMVGLIKGRLTFDDPHFHKHELTLKSSRNGTSEDLQQVIDAIRDGLVDTENFITHRCGFDKIVDQFEAWILPETNVIKAMVEIN